MNAMASVFPFTLRWDSQDLADAVPLRLFDLVDFAAGNGEAANAHAASLRARIARSYLPGTGLAARFVVRD